MTARETGLYYLQSRYYNPTWGRFLNADVFVATGQGMLGNNMFAYCNNNPVCYFDPSGNMPDYPCDNIYAYFGYCLADLFWDLLEEDTEETLHEVGDAVCNNFEFSFGLGVGLFFGFDIEEFFTVEAGLYYDVFHVEYSDGEWETGEYGYEGINSAIPFVPIIDESTEQYRSSDSESWVSKTSQPSAGLFGTGAYLFGGGAISVGFDIIQFCDDINRIFCD